MTCYRLPTAVLIAAWVAVIWRFHRVITEVLQWAGIAAAAIATVAASYLTARGILWAGRKIRTRQTTRGACLTCTRPCQQPQVTPSPAPALAADTAEQLPAGFRVPAPPVLLPVPELRQREQISAWN